jgi:hypothetical protein
LLTLNQIHAQIVALANAHYQIAEVGMGTIAELQGKPDRSYPLLWLSNEGGSVEGNYKVDNIRLTMFGRVIVGEEGQDDDASEIEVLSDMQLILLDFLNYFHQQHGQEYVTDKAATLEHFTERTNDRTAGYSCVLELKQFYDWNKCQIPQSGATIPPSIDGLTLYDFCDASVIDRLTAEQVACLEAEFGQCADATVENSDASYSTTVASGATLVLPNIDFTDSDGTTTSVPSVQNIVATPIPPCADATVQLNGTTVGTVASGDSDSFTVNLDGSPSGSWDGTAWQVTSPPCDDATIELNGVEMTTIPSGDTENISVRQSSGATEVGSKQGVHWRIDDSAISINGSPVADVKAEDPLDIDVTQGGSPVGSWNGSEWVIPTCPVVPSLSVGLSSSSVTFGTSVIVTPTPTNLTAPITYTMSAKNSLGYYVDSVVVDGTFTYDCPFAGTFDIQLSAVDSLGNRAENVASITVGTIYAKHAITAAWEGKDSVLVSGQVDSITDATGNGNTATAPSSVTRLIKHSQITSQVAGVSTNANNSTRRLASTVSQLVSTITYFAVIDFNADGLSGAFGVQAILGGSATPASNLGSRYNFIIDTSTNKINFGIRNASGANGASILSTNALSNGINIIVGDYTGTTLTLILNGVTQTASYSSTLWTPASCDIILANTNVSSYTGGCSKPIWVAGVKTSNVADPAQLYTDLVTKYTL